MRIGLRPIGDNSMLLHMRTGIDIVHSGSVPHRDPYSFTAAGHTWIVQSWLAEATYGVMHRIGGFHAVVLEQAVLMALIVFAVGALARTGSGLHTALAAGVGVLGGIFLWSPRPLLFGLLGMALLVLVVERRRPPYLLVPILWVWVNTHGSFPFAVAWIGARYIGAALDTRRRPRWLEPYALAIAGGLAISALNPFGVRLLTFPLVVGRDRTVFQHIAEWQSPNFQSAAEFVSLLVLAVGLVILIRQSAPWTDVLPVAGFLVAGLISERNLAVAAIVMAPALARSLTSATVPGWVARAPKVTTGPGLPPVAVPAGVLAALVLVLSTWNADPLRLAIYPTAAHAYMATHGLLEGHRIAAFDLVGDYEGFIDGPRHEVFLDDRYDMYPASVVHDSQALQAGRKPALDVLNRWQIDEVLWHKDEGPTDLLTVAGGWRLAWSDKTYDLFVRT